MPSWNGTCESFFKSPSTAMCPIDPASTVPAGDRSPMDNPFDEGDPDLTLVEQGMDVADDEMRDAVTDAYEEDAVEDEEAEDSLNDIDYTPDEDDSDRAPEVEAMHESPPR